MPEQLNTTRSGLFAADAVAVALTGVSVDAEISSFCARVAVTQRYVNRESHSIEAVYVFPLDEGAAVCGFEAIVDGTLVVGEVKEREDAFRAYDDAIQKGDGAFLLDEERPDVFQASVGNLPAGKEVLLKVTYVTELTVAGSGLRFSIPTTVSPRYAPAQDRRGLGRPDSEALNPPVAWSVPYGLDLSVRLTMGGAISRLESPSHPVSVSMDGCTATVSLSQRDAALDRDFVLSVECAGLDTPQVWIERDEHGDAAVAVAFVPQLGHAATPCDVTFLVDRSGSMAGTSIGEVRNALQLCLRSMTPGCMFNIVGFGSRFESLFPGTRAYDEKSLAEASAHVGGLAADLGGTEILPALQFVLDHARSGTLPRQVVVLTDGEVTNTDAVIELARKHAADARIFTFGIGAGSSQHLVKGLARAGGGSAEFIHPGERIEPKVLRQFGRLLSPVLTDVRVSWGAVDARQAPSTIPPIFAGERLLLYAFVKGQSAGTVRLSASGLSGPLAFAVALDHSRIVDGRTVATLAARARIRELEESLEWTSSRGSRQQGRKATGARSEVIELSVRYGLISRETSFVAIERRETPVLGDMQLRRIPVALTAGWGGLDASASPVHAISSSARPVPASAAVDYASRAPDEEVESPTFSSRMASTGRAPMRPTSSLKPMAPLTGAVTRGLNQLRKWGSGTRSPEPGAPRPLSTAADGVPSRMVALIALQRADGSWNLTPEFARAIGCELTELESAVAGAAPKDEARSALATTLALAWLEEHAGDAEVEWRLLAAKARTWLAGVTARPLVGSSWAEAGARVLTGAKSR